VLIDFVGPAYALRTPNLNAQQCINWYVRAGGPGGKSAGALYPTPGLEAFVTLAAAAKVRGLISTDDKLYAVSGTKLYSITEAGTMTELGTIPGTDPISLAHNGVEVFVANGTSTGYRFVISGSTFSSVALPAAIRQVVFLDGYFVGVELGGQKVYVSTLYDGSAWASLDFASAEINPDKSLAIIADQRELMIAGTKSTEFWYNSGNADYPFERISGGITEYGCAAPWSVASIADSKFWLTNHRTVVMASQWQAQPIGTDALHETIAGYSTISDAEGMTYRIDGHYFYALTFPTEGATWVYDLNTQMWHERQSPSLTHFRGTFCTELNGVWYVGDYTNGKVYKLTPTVYTENGAVVTRTRTTPVISEEDKRITLTRLQIDFEEGINAAGDPQADLSWSKDGGHTFSPVQSESIGATGAYTNRVVWRRIGQFREIIFKLQVAHDMRAIVLGAFGELEVGED